MIDTHSHIYLDDFSEDFDETVSRAKNVGISNIVLPNIDINSIENMFRVCDQDEAYFKPLLGLHPTSVNKLFERDLKTIFDLYNERKFYGIGEIGIDLYWDKTHIEEQIKAFQFQVDFAIQNHLPIVIHTRDSFSETFDALKVFNPAKIHGVFHSFTGGSDEISAISKLGNFYFGINGIVTFKNSDLRNHLNEIELARLLLETDSPYLAPVPFRGKRNESSYLYYICKHIAENMNLPFEEVDLITSNNAKMLFNL